MRYIFLVVFMSMLSCVTDDKEDKQSTDLRTESVEEISRINVDARLDSLGIKLGSVAAPVANYVNVVQTGNLLFLAGKGPRTLDGELVTGKVGLDLSIEEGYEAAKLVAYSQLAVIKDHLGDLSKVKRIVKVLGMVNCESDFENQPEVINGFSDVMVSVFGEAGKHARAAVGMASLPRNICVEIEMIVEVY